MCLFYPLNTNVYNGLKKVKLIKKKNNNLDFIFPSKYIWIACSLFLGHTYSRLVQSCSRSDIKLASLLNRSIYNPVYIYTL